jgi:hypothetical protein
VRWEKVTFCTTGASASSALAQIRSSSKVTMRVRVIAVPLVMVSNFTPSTVWNL